MEKYILGLLVFIVGLIIKEIKDNGSGRAKLHQRIDNLDIKYVQREICHTHVDSIKEDLKEIKSDLKEVLRLNGK